MLTLISGTNRPGALSQVIASAIHACLTQLKIEHQYINLQEIDLDFVHSGMYSPTTMSPALKTLQEQAILPATKFIIVSPEYNGSDPGILKLFIDAVSINEYKASFSAKKVALVGVSSGRAGNLRGLDQLTAVCNHVGMNVFPDKRPISRVTQFLNEEKTALIDQGIIKALKSWCEAFDKF